MKETTIPPFILNILFRRERRGSVVGHDDIDIRVLKEIESSGSLRETIGPLNLAEAIRYATADPSNWAQPRQATTMVKPDSEHDREKT